MTTTVERADERFLTDVGWLHSRHSFNFGNHWSPLHNGHGLLLVNNDALAAGGLVAIASGQGHETAVSIHQRGAVLWGARLGAGESVTVPAAPYVHVFVALGQGTLDTAGALAQGDAARLTHAGELGFTATADHTEVLIWTTN